MVFILSSLWEEKIVMDNTIINTLYIDDGPEPALSTFLATYSQEGFSFTHKDIKFNPQSGYESLLEDNRVKTANIIFIDSKLFENRTVVDSKLSGEEFKIILKKEYPFIEVFVITQNEIETGMDKIAKYNSTDMEDLSAREYYEQVIPSRIQNALKNIMEYRLIVDKMKGNSFIERLLVEKITNSLEGNGIYDELKKADIDQLICTFKEVQALIDGK